MQVTTQNMTVPKLRFKEFEAGWIKNRLSKISDVNPKNTPLKSTFIYIDLESVQDGRLIKEEQICKNEAPSRAQRTLIKKDVIYQTVRPYQKNNYFFNLEGNYVASTGYAQIRTKQNSQFIYQLLHTDNFVNKVLVRCTGTSYPSINSSDLKDIYIHHPTLPEQEKIASFLSSVDERIQKLERKKSLLEEYKKGVMQKIFSQELRFKDDNGNNYPNWEEKKLGELCDLKNGYAFKSSSYNNKGAFNIVTIKNVQDGKMVADFNKICTLPTNIENYQILELDDILISMTGNVGRVCKVIFNKCLLNQRVGKIVPKDVHKEYLYFVLNNKKFIQTMENTGQGAAQMNIGKKDILAYKGIHPSEVEEQQKIASFLSGIDKKIELVETQIQQSKTFKKGLLQQMFV